MTDKHFKVLAAALHEERPGEHWDLNKHVQWDLDVKAIARVCSQFNPSFDYNRFIEACGGLFNV
jgi:hypothetical protein